MNKILILAIVATMLILLTACSGNEDDDNISAPTSLATPVSVGQGADDGGSSIVDDSGSSDNTDATAYHTSSMPDEYSGLKNPIPADEASIARGQAHFDQFCASCHGSQGRGDGPAAANLEPAPPMIAETSLELGDDVLFWRISEGGAFEPYNSAMPPWKAILDEEARWDVINYARTLSEIEGTQ